MPLGQQSVFWQLYDDDLEQKLLEDLICESIEIYGVPCRYIARNYNNLDQIYGQDDSSSYTYTWPIALFLQNVLGFTGDREFINKLSGLEIRDQLVFSIPRRTFDMLVASDPNFPPLPNHISLHGNRPREGDLIFINLKHLQKCFKIMYVNLTDMMFPLGKVYTWQVTTELFEYSGEQFNTGIAEIDRIQTRGDLNFLDYLVTDLVGTPILLDGTSDWWLNDSYNLSLIAPLADNQNIQTEANNYINFSANTDPFVDSNNMGGVI